MIGGKVALCVIASVSLVAASCGGGGERASEPNDTDSATAGSAASDDEPSSPTEAPTPTDAPVATEAVEQPVAEPPSLVTPVDFSQEPFITFAPVPPRPERLPADFPTPDGAQDFHELFEPDAPWQNALEHVDAFKIHSWMIRHYFTDDELIRMSDRLRELGVALIVEAEPLDPPDPAECQHMESFEGPYEIENAVRLRDLGVAVAAYAIEQPYSIGHKLIAEGACNYELDRVLDEVVAWAADLRAVYPDIPIGSIEALWERPPTTPADYAVWIDAWTEAMGEPPAFQHVDVNFVVEDWPETLRGIEDVVEARGVPFGPLYNGFLETENDAWIARTIDHIATYESVWGGTPGQVTIQSWYPQPDRLLPDDDPGAMTNLVTRYVGERTEIVDVAVDEATGTVTGRLVDQDGTPLAGLDVDVGREVGAGDRQVITARGTVPGGADQAIMLFRINAEGAAGAVADVTVHSVGYAESLDGEPDAEVVGLVPDGEMTGSGWGIDADNNGGLAEFVADGENGALRLVGELDAPIQVDGSLFPVTAGAGYVLAIDLTVADASTNGPLAVGFFADGAEFDRVLVDLRAEPIELGVATTDTSGRFSIPATVSPDSTLTLTTDGDGSSWPASVTTPLD